MPSFTAPISVARLAYEGYSLYILSPKLDFDDSQPPLMPAYIARDVPGCCISEALAKAYDPFIEEGDLLFLHLIEQQEDGVVHQYPLAVPVRFAKTDRRDYVQIGLDHIRLVFDVTEYNPKDNESRGAKRLHLSLRRCAKYPSDPDGDQEGIEPTPSTPSTAQRF